MLYVGYMTTTASPSFTPGQQPSGWLPGCHQGAGSLRLETDST